MPSDVKSDKSLIKEKTNKQTVFLSSTANKESDAAEGKARCYMTYSVVNDAQTKIKNLSLLLLRNMLSDQRLQ